MFSYKVNPEDKEELSRAATAFYELYSEELQCDPRYTTPDIDSLERIYTVIVCEDNTGVVGALCVLDGDVLYPVIKNNYHDVLASLILKAREVCGPLHAQTDNEIILTTAVEMGIGVKREGNRLVYAD